ncbi:hypothetical protein VPH35_059064 [Triticum aestivum]
MNCVQIEESNEMGTEVLPALDNKGRQPLHPMPDEVVLPPTAEEDPKTPEGGDDEGMEEPPATDFTKHFVVVPTEFKLRNNTGCSWKIKIGYMVTFKLLTPDTLKVIMFDEDGIEVVNKCGKHDEAFAAKE